MVFATGVAHSVHLRDEFRRSGVWAEHIDGSTPVDERDEILARLSEGKVELVTNCMVLTEGWDQPDLSCCILARPTKHIGLYRQMVGRVLRPSPGKTHALIIDHAGAVFQHGFAEDQIVWTLDKDRRAQNRTHASRFVLNGRELTTCPECSAIRWSGKQCSSCGWRPVPKPRHVDVADGDLARVDRDGRIREGRATPADKVSFHRQLLWIARENGYKPGWAAHKHKEKFGAWPESRDATPEPPSDAVRSWVRSRNIAYAKAMKRAS